MSTDRQHTATYITENQHKQWKERANELDMTLSEFIQAMTEAGMKKFEVAVEPDETNRELRTQRNDLQKELDSARDRIQSLEDQLYRREYSTIVRFIHENSGATYDDIVRHVISTVPVRVNDHLQELEGEEIEEEADSYKPITGDNSS